MVKLRCVLFSLILRVVVLLCTVQAQWSMSRWGAVLLSRMSSACVALRKVDEVHQCVLWCVFIVSVLYSRRLTLDILRLLLFLEMKRRPWQARSWLWQMNRRCPWSRRICESSRHIYKTIINITMYIESEWVLQRGLRPEPAAPLFVCIVCIQLWSISAKTGGLWFC